MKLAGEKYDGFQWQQSHRVQEAIVSPDRIALDWVEYGVRYHLLAHSHDGSTTYQGHYGMFRPEEDWLAEITRYTAVDGSLVLLCDWHEHEGLRAGGDVDGQARASAEYGRGKGTSWPDGPVS